MAMSLELTRDFCQSHAPTAETTLSAPGCRASSSGCLHTAFAAEEMKRKFLSQLVHEMLREKMAASCHVHVGSEIVSLMWTVCPIHGGTGISATLKELSGESGARHA
eukprot:CAMPEP_0178438326 /NCGR_PEP_ID=MMETSP0689_2-20121128/35532_1 /TAXON_ID=160604 /ORGANISM="Amphidinium massartii, Strain CS-259" /LENGTH=106 /DNA_ID=CAMNT_0020060719 /DNA_START=92 /DNA_END=412 /DNA_ORIENTATION=+